MLASDAVGRPYTRGKKKRIPAGTSELRRFKILGMSDYEQNTITTDLSNERVRVGARFSNPMQDAAKPKVFAKKEQKGCTGARLRMAGVLRMPPPRPVRCLRPDQTESPALYSWSVNEEPNAVAKLIKLANRPAGIGAGTLI